MECTELMNESLKVDALLNAELVNTGDIQEEVRKLFSRFKNQTRTEDDRQNLVASAKAKSRDNQKLLKQMKNLIENNTEKAVDFEILYKAMNDSEDYHQKKPIVEKKLRNIA